MSDIINVRSYDEILAEMQEDFKEKSGFFPDNASDIGIRLKVLAAQIYSLNCKLNWIWKQSSPLSAVGEYLDRLAAEKGISRKNGRKSTGLLTFSLDEPMQRAIDIEKGTLVGVSTLSEAVKFVTVSDISIPGGQTSAVVAAQAVNMGVDGNVAAGAVKVILSEGFTALSVTNENAFTGGSEPENDDSLRKRVTDSYMLPVYLGTESYYKSVALADEEVVSAGVVPLADGPGTVRVAVASGGYTQPRAEVLERLNNTFADKRDFGVQVSVTAANSTLFDIDGDITVSFGYDPAEVKLQCEAVAAKYADTLGVGGSFIKARLYKEIMDIPAVKNVALTAPASDINAAGDCVLKLNSARFHMISG